MEIFQKEVFGPVLTWNTFRDDDEVIEVANATEYGLAATLFTGNEERAMRIASAVVAGTVWVNCFFIRELAAPFGGSRAFRHRPRRRHLELRFLLRHQKHRRSKGSFA